MYLKKISFWVFILSISIFLSCGTFKGERTYSKNGLKVTYRSFSRFGSGIEDYSIQHPINISPKLAKNHLLALWYRNIDHQGAANPVFSFRAIEDLTPLIIKAFGKVKPGKYLHFEFRTQKGITSGDAFASTGKIHWRFLKINGIDYSNDPLRLRKPTWKLIRSRGQSYKKVKTDIAYKSQENWVLVNLKLPEFKRRPTSPHSSSQLKKKLKALKNLFDAGRIDRKEYRKKRKQIIRKAL